MIAGKVAVVCGYGDVGKGSAQALKALCTSWVTEVDPICALQAAMEGYKVVTMEYAADKADIFVTATGNKSVIGRKHIEAMKNEAIVCNIGHFDNEIDVSDLEDLQWEEIKPQVDHVIFPDGKRIILLAKGRLVNLGCATGHPSYVMSSSFANQVLAQSSYFVIQKGMLQAVYVLPKHLDEKVARLHLESIGAELTELSQDQAAYIGVEVLVHTRLRLTDINVGIKRGVLSPKTGEGISRFNKAADELVPVGFGFASVTMAQEVPLGRHLTAARELKKGSKKECLMFHATDLTRHRFRITKTYSNDGFLG